MSFRARSIKALIRNRGNRTEGQRRVRYSIIRHYPSGMLAARCPNTISAGTRTSTISWSQSFRPARSLDETRITLFLYRSLDWCHLLRCNLASLRQSPGVTTERKVPHIPSIFLTKHE
ncbi:hypothetical protein F2P79_002399 [Pimephales promelas]|nr:hypothetical protein F2P79_002399 [Pimephales promelas]